MAHKRWADRRDAVCLRDLPALNQIMPSLLPNRADNEAYLRLDIDLRPIEAYLAKLNAGKTDDRYTYFHIISAAIAKAFVLRPRMNRFICNNRIYQRNDVSLAFVVKKKFDDKSEEALAFMTYSPKDTLQTFHERLVRLIHENRREDTKDASTDVMDIVTRLPHFLTVGIVKLVRWLDKFGKAPAGMVSQDPNHAAIFLSNLGSIGLECGYHHLVNWGTNSFFVVLGKKKMTVDYDKDGNADCHEILPLGITLDERIADGYYYSGTAALVRELLLHPQLLEASADTPVEFAIHR